MTTPFDFVPRIVSKHAKPWQGISRFSPTPSPSPDLVTDCEEEEEEDVVVSESDRSKGKEKAIEHVQSKQAILTQDIASLISLALSDYNIWLDADLRRKLDACLTDESCPDGAGFVPINYLLRRAPFRGSLARVGDAQHEPSETEVVKALRAHGVHLEVRMRLPSSSSVWYGTGKTSRKKDVGGYEVRRKDWVSLCDRPSRGWTRARWDDVTTYVEGIPPQYRTVGGIVRFIETLFMPEPIAVQTVILPPHYLDKPGDTPKCKGYALVTLSTKSHADALRHKWPWNRVPLEETETDTSEAVHEAHKYGFRTISKARWDAFNEEYLLYKQSLVDAMAHTEDEVDIWQHADRGQRGDEDGPQSQTQRHVVTPSSPYPFDCLVFVRNIHPETNKTTLKTLFGRAFQEGIAIGVPVESSLDYVDFNKGMDTCYLRLASPQHAIRLITYFGAREMAQGDGLDGVGHSPVQNEKPIMAEMVQGRKEQVYWDKVPEKVRRQAVNKVAQVQADEISEATNDARGSEQKKRRREP